MKPGQRVDLIQQLADALSEHDWDDVDLLLRQFGFTYSHDRAASKRTYAISHLESGTDDGLLQLHEHLFGFRGDPESTTPGFWNTGHFRLFLSHISSDRSFTSDLKEALAKYGIAGFCAHEDIEPTREWVDEIEAALGTCDALAAILVPGFKESDWTDQEVGFCHGRRVLILSVRRGLDPYGFIARYQGVPGGDRAPSEIAEKLYRILVGHTKTAARMAEALVTAFECSDSFAEAKRMVRLLQDVKSWTPELLRRIEQASNQNDQISGAWGVSEQVEAIVRSNSVDASTTVGGSGTLPPAGDDIPF